MEIKMTKLTKTLVDAAQAQEKDLILWDSELKGFMCKITPKNKKVYFLYYRTKGGRQRKPKIGAHGEITCEQARKIAKTWLFEVAQGKDPSVERKTMTKYPINPVKIHVKLFKAVERGVNYGYCRAFKYEESPLTDRLENNLKNLITQNVMNEISEIIDFDKGGDDESRESREELPFNRNLLEKVGQLELSVRSANCLKKEKIHYIGDLVQRSEFQMLRIPEFGRKSLNELKEVLGEMGLGFNMTIKGWPPENIEELIKKLKREESNND